MGGGFQLGPLGTAVTNRRIVPTPGDYDDREFGGMTIGRGSRSTWRRPTPVSGPSARRTKDLLRLNRDRLRWVVGLLTGHCHLKGHLFKLGLINDPICERHQEEVESATHILCDCEAVAQIRFRHLGQFFIEPSDYYDTPIDKVLHFIRGVGLIKG
jgi:hypothetical protein